MSNIQESVTWESTIYQIGTSDAVLGGNPVKVDGQFTSGYANAPIQQLANRSQYLKQQLEATASNVQTMGSQVATAQSQISDLTGRINALEGQVATAQSQISSLGTAVETNTSEIDAIRQHLDSIDTQIEDIIQRLTELESNPGGGSTGMVGFGQQILSLSSLTPGDYLWDASYGSKTIDLSDVPDNGVYNLFAAGPGIWDTINFTLPDGMPDGIDSISYYFNTIGVPESFFSNLVLYPQNAYKIEVVSMFVGSEWFIKVSYHGMSNDQYRQELVINENFINNNVYLIIQADGIAKLVGKVRYVGDPVVEPSQIEIGGLGIFSANREHVTPIVMEDTNGILTTVNSRINNGSNMLYARFDYLQNGDEIHLNMPIELEYSEPS